MGSCGERNRGRRRNPRKSASCGRSTREIRAHAIIVELECSLTAEEATAIKQQRQPKRKGQSIRGGKQQSKQTECLKGQRKSQKKEGRVLKCCRGAD